MPARLELADDLEQSIPFGRGEARRRLVEGDDAAAAGERPADLDQLAVRHAEFDRPAGVTSRCGSKAFDDPPCFLPVPIARDDVQAARASQKDILRDVELRHQAQFLADEADAERQRGARTVDTHRADGIEFDGRLGPAGRRRT